MVEIDQEYTRKALEKAKAECRHYCLVTYWRFSYFALLQTGNEIEPGVSGGRKIAATILNLEGRMFSGYCFRF
jgi:hypothetical protein